MDCVVITSTVIATHAFLPGSYVGGNVEGFAGVVSPEISDDEGFSIITLTKDFGVRLVPGVDVALRLFVFALSLACLPLNIAVNIILVPIVQRLEDFL